MFRFTSFAGGVCLITALGIGCSKDPEIAKQEFLRNGDRLAYSGLELAQISNVSFQYGTGFGQPSFSGGGGNGSQVPEPMTLLLVAPAAALVVRRRLKSKVSQ